MNVKIIPSTLSGKIEAIPSKSHVHRLLICAALSKGETTITLPFTSKDIEATLDCISALGAEVLRVGNDILIRGIKGKKESVLLNAVESGSTLRFLLPVASVMAKEASFVGSGRLPERPIGDLISALEENGASFSGKALPLTKTGDLKSGIFTLPGNVSSQFVSGLLFALPLLEGDSEIRLSSPLESAGYVDMTLSVLALFGIDIERKENSFFIKGGSEYRSPENISVEGDWSNAAFFLVADAIGSSVEVLSLDAGSAQKDKEVTKIIEAFKNKTSNIEIDLKDIPDLLPILAVLSSFSKGKTRFYGGKRLKIKESDRLKTTVDMINALGGDAKETDDGIEVIGKRLSGGTVDGAGDHRIVMAAAIAGAHSQNETIILGAEASEKSYPSFFEDYKKLGGECYVV